MRQDAGRFGGRRSEMAEILSPLKQDQTMPPMLILSLALVLDGGLSLRRVSRIPAYKSNWGATWT